MKTKRAYMLDMAMKFYSQNIVFAFTSRMPRLISSTYAPTLKMTIGCLCSARTAGECTVKGSPYSLLPCLLVAVVQHCRYF